MRKLFVLLIFTFCLVIAANTYAIKPGECKYVKDDKVKVNDQGYIMSWLILDPYFQTNEGSTIAVAKDYFEDKGGEANLKPKEGDKVKIKATGTEHVWTRLNFSDLKDMGQIPAPVGGNELDIVCWGGQGVNNAQEYLVTYLLWKKDNKVTITLGSDDSSESYFNGEQVTFKAADQDWAAGNGGSGTVDAKAGQWNILVVGAYETGGEWGISVQVNPVPDEVDNKGPAALFAVDPADKLPNTWGNIKGSY